MTLDSGNDEAIPASVRYVKSGQGGKWWRSAKTERQVHLGWNKIPRELLLAPVFVVIERLIRNEYGSRSGATKDFNSLRDLLDRPSQLIWITFEDGCMWWCTVLDGAVVNPAGEGADRGHFWLRCARPWSNRSLVKRTQLSISDMPVVVTTTAGFQGTVCRPGHRQAIIRIIRDEQDPDTAQAAIARRRYSNLKTARRLATALRRRFGPLRLTIPHLGLDHREPFGAGKTGNSVWFGFGRRNGMHIVKNRTVANRKQH
jgi:hypothetical protein